MFLLVIFILNLLIIAIAAHSINQMCSISSHRWDSLAIFRWWWQLQCSLPVFLCCPPFCPLSCFHCCPPFYLLPVEAKLSSYPFGVATHPIITASITHTNANHHRHRRYQFTNAIYIINGDSKNLTTVYIYNATTESWSAQTTSTKPAPSGGPQFDSIMIPTSFVSLFPSSSLWMLMLM